MVNTKRRKREKTTRASQRSVLTFANPNYNGVDALNQPDPGSSSGKSGLFKRLRYDKCQV